MGCVGFTRSPVARRGRRLGSRSVVDALPEVGGIDVLEALGIVAYQCIGVFVPEGAVSVVRNVVDRAVAELIVAELMAPLVHVVPVLVDAAVLDLVALMSGVGLRSRSSPDFMDLTDHRSGD